MKWLLSLLRAYKDKIKLFWSYLALWIERAIKLAIFTVCQGICTANTENWAFRELTLMFDVSSCTLV